MTLNFADLVRLEPDVVCHVQREDEFEISHLVVLKTPTGDVTFRPDLATPSGHCRAQDH